MDKYIISDIFIFNTFYPKNFCNGSLLESFCLFIITSLILWTSFVPLYSESFKSIFPLTLDQESDVPFVLFSLFGFNSFSSSNFLFLAISSFLFISNSVKYSAAFFLISILASSSSWIFLLILALRSSASFCLSDILFFLLHLFEDYLNL